MIKFGKKFKETVIVIAIIGFIFRFIRKAFRAGRILEFLISTLIVVGTYYLMFTFGDSLSGWLFTVPISVYYIYWCYLFSHEKITDVRANSHWADRDWWWKLDGWEFEEEVAKVFRLNGYEAKVTKKTGDGGIDILMYKDKDKIIVQCKHYSDPIGVSVVRELNGVKDDFKADKLIIVASSGATDPCYRFLRNKPYFKILDLEDVIRMGLRPHSS